jgi:hypothetical protein
MNNLSITQMRLIWTLAALFAINTFVPNRAAWAQISTPSHPLQGGPNPNDKRSQPANLLVVDGKPWLVDCSYGASERLAAADMNRRRPNRFPVVRRS